jgi:exodeoxyribonuclease VIII
MTTKDYRAADAVNFSSLKHILTSPAHYQAALAEKREETRAMLLGTLTHALVLEGKDLEQLVAVKPEGMNLATKEGKAWKESAGDLPIISEDEADDIEMMVYSILRNPHAAAMLKACQQRETPLFANIRGVGCKALLDAHGTDGVEWVVCDLKTTDDASPEAFARKVANLHYDMQAAFYCQVLAAVHQVETPPHWYWIAVEKKPPYTCAVYRGHEWMEGGESKVERALERLKECRESGNWPQPWQGINELPKPKWA